MAELLGTAVREADGIPGVLVRDVYLDPKAVLTRLQAMRGDGIDLRIAYLDPDAASAAAAAGIPHEIFSTRVEDAERWRNEPGLEALVVVITESDAAKLTSLEEFRLIGPVQLRRLLVDRAISKFDEINDVLTRWWEIIGKDEQISFLDLVDYFQALEPLDPEEAKRASALQINRLGLLPDPGFFNSPGEKQLRARLDENRALALRLANFSEEDRAKVDEALDDEGNADRRVQLRRQLRDLQLYRRGGQLGLTADDARQLLKVRSTMPPGLAGQAGAGRSGNPREPLPALAPPKSLGELVIDVLLQPTKQDLGARRSGDSEPRPTAPDITPPSLEAAMASLSGELQHLEKNEKLSDTVRPLPIKVSLPSGTAIDEELRTDVLNFVSRVIDENKFGALIAVQGGDIATMVRNFQQTAEMEGTWGPADVSKLLDAFAASSPQFQPIRDAFNTFDVARKKLLSGVRELCVAPLPYAVAPNTSGRVTALVDSYRNLLTITTGEYSSLHLAFGDDARALVELVMLIDTVFLKNERDASLVALMTPLHPLLLWHYVEYARVITEQRDALDSRDRELVREEFDAGGVPFFLPSLDVPRSVYEMAALSLPFSGKLGNLPHFSERANARDPKDGVRLIRRLVEAFVAMHPSSAYGLRLALLDPPDAGAFLSMCCDLAEESIPALRGAHITILRRGHGVGAELNLSADEERRVQQRFGDHHDRRFTFETMQVGPADFGPPSGIMPHIFVAFDQTRRNTASAGSQFQKLQPLANSRRLVYSISTGTLDMEPEIGGILADYVSFGKLAGGAGISYSRSHQSQQLRARFRQGASDVPWYVVADGHVDRDLNIGGLRIFTGHEGSRDVAAFARTPDAFRRSLRDVVRQYNTWVKDETLDELLATLSELLDTGLLALRPSPKTGEIVHAQVKGVLGLMVAVQHLRVATPAGHDRIILSLDDDQARRWLHLNDNRDNLRADLLVIDGADDRYTVTVVEVKTRQDVDAEYAVVNGEAVGPAISQLLSTHRILRRVFDASARDLLLTPSRREIIREHLYRELSKSSYDHDARKRWAERSRKLFSHEADVNLRCALIDVQLGVDKSGLEATREVHATDSDGVLVAISLRHVNEDGVPGLEEALKQPEPQSTRDTQEGEPPGAGDISPVKPSGPVPAGANRAAIPEPLDRDGLPSAETAQSGTATSPIASSRPRVLLGQATVAYSQREVWFDPENPEQRLNNPHVSISGETGSGKTQATKAILHELLPTLPALILDFKDDYAKADYAGTEGLAVHDASFGSLPFNPMVPPVDPETGRVNPTAHVHELADMMQRIYRLGDQQTYQLREAIKETYSISGVGAKPFVPGLGQQYLPFDAIRDVLVREEAQTLLGRLSPVFDLGLFSASGDETASLAELLATPSVIRLSQLPGDQVKNAVAEFFLLALYGFLIRREQPHKLERILVLDEAWRLVNSPKLQPLMREGRAFGLGVVIATQFPRDLPENIAGSTATRIFFNQTKAEQIREIQRTLVGKTTGQEADHLGNLIRGLAPLECVFQNIHYKPWVRLRAIPYYSRLPVEPDGGVTE
jgi:hypothetical protein